MSLFKSRDWWSTKSPNEEEYGQGGMCLGNIDNDPDGQGNFVQDRHFFLI